MAYAQAYYVHGERTTEKFTASGAKSSGDVVVVGTVAGVCTGGAANGELGSMDLTGTYDVAKITEQAFAVGATVYWNATADPVDGAAETGAATATVEDLVLGICTVAAGQDDARVRVKLQQYEVPSS